MIDEKHERLAAWLLLAWLAFGVIGIVAVIGGVSAGMILTARWVFGI